MSIQKIRQVDGQIIPVEGWVYKSFQNGTLKDPTLLAACQGRINAIRTDEQMPVSVRFSDEYHRTNKL